MYNVSKETVASAVFEAFHKDISSDDFKLYGPGDTDHFYITHTETERTFKFQVTETTKDK